MKFATISLALMAFVAASFADTVTTKDGSVLQGTVEKVTDGKVQLKTAYAGSITIALDQVIKMETAETMPVHLKDGSVIVGTLKPAADGLSLLRAEDQSQIPVAVGDIASVNPPAKPPVKWKGSVVGNLAITDGNSRNTGAGLSADAIRRAEIDRITFRGGYFYSENQGAKTRDDLFLSGKYDYFMGKKVYAYGTSRLDRDTIKSLTLRTTVGGGLGYQFLENDIRELSGEAGASFVNEDYVLAADDQRYAAGRLAGRYSWWIRPKQLRFEENAEFLFGLNDIEDLIAISDSSLIWQWTEKWSSRATLRFEWDNTPAGGQKRLDTKIELGVGFSY